MFTPPIRLGFLVAALMSVMTTQSSALSLSVELACAADYYAYCSKHDPDSPGVRACMNAHGEKLSNRCLKALIGAGEVSKSEVDRRQAAKGK
jgi:hypothetical protein